jgi:2,5-diketo-D-gluconate reductase A
MSDAIAPTVQLPNGALMPRLGLGTWPMDDAQAEVSVAEAISAGYRLVDTAENYRNETGVGRGLKASGVDRSELFVTSKFNKEWHATDLVAEAFQRSADRLGVDYIDLLLVHWPNPALDRYVDAWRGLIELRESGAVRAIGTSNFKPAHLQRVIDATGVTPEVNQIQLSPALGRAEERAFHSGLGIVTQSWGPLGGNGAAVLDAPVLAGLARKYERTPGQIALRWHMELGLAAVPKSTDPRRMRENIDIFDFALDKDDVAAITAMDQGQATAADSDRFGH